MDRIRTRGAGGPAFIAPRWTIYVDETNGDVWLNRTDGIADWVRTLRTSFLDVGLIHSAESALAPPNVGSELPNAIGRTKIDLSGYTFGRLIFIESTGLASIRCSVQYSADQMVWSAFLPEVSSQGSNGLSSGGFQPIPAAAQTDIFLRALIHGDGLITTTVRKIIVQTK